MVLALTTRVCMCNRRPDEKLEIFGRGVRCTCMKVWEAMSKVWESISELEETPWTTAIPRKVRKLLDTVQQGMRNLPNRVRQYEPFDHAQVKLCVAIVDVTYM